MKKFNVLFAINQAQDVRQLEQSFDEKDFNVGFLSEGTSAIANLDKEEADVVFIDLDTDVEKGFEMCKAIKSNIKLKEIPVVFISGVKEEEIISRCFECGG